MEEEIFILDDSLNSYSSVEKWCEFGMFIFVLRQHLKIGKAVHSAIVKNTY